MRFLTALLFIGLFIGCTQKKEQKKQQPTAQTAAAIDTSLVMNEGKQITKVAAKTLVSNLKQAMSEGGIENALRFCNVEAMPITDSLSRNYDVTIARASHRPRNQSNRADSLEMQTIKKYLSQIDKEQKLEPAIYKAEDAITFHAPIQIPNGLCLSCHGEPGVNIAEADLKTIKELYPEDEATGFEMGELRGIWTIRFPNSYFSESE